MGGTPVSADTPLPHSHKSVHLSGVKGVHCQGQRSSSGEGYLVGEVGHGSEEDKEDQGDQVVVSLAGQYPSLAPEEHDSKPASSIRYISVQLDPKV